MATLHLTITAEWGGAVDAMRTLQRVHEALAKRHGDAFRALDRRIDALLEDGALLLHPEVIDLGDGHWSMRASDEAISILVEARRLGVIPA